MVKNNIGKDDRIVIRVDKELKDEFTRILNQQGTTPSDYLRRYIVNTINEWYFTQSNHVNEENSLKDEYKADKVEILEVKMSDIEKSLNTIIKALKKDGKL